MVRGRLGRLPAHRGAHLGEGRRQVHPEAHLWEGHRQVHPEAHHQVGHQDRAVAGLDQTYRFRRANHRARGPADSRWGRARSLRVRWAR